MKNYVYQNDQASGGTSVVQSALYTAGEEFFTSDSCTVTSRALGKMVHYAVFFEIADANVEDLLLTNITA